MAQKAGLLDPYVEIGAYEELLSEMYVLGLKEAPLLVRLPKISVANHRIDWIERGMLPISCGINGATASSAVWSSSTTVTIRVSDASIFKLGDLVGFERSSGTVGTLGTEICRVLTNNLVSILTVTRKVAGTAQAINAAWSIVRLPAALISGGNALSALAALRVKAYNYTQVMSETVYVPGDSDSMEVVGGKLLAQEVAFGLLEHAKNCEQGIIRGRRAVGTSATARTMGGLLQFIASGTIVSVSSNALTFARLDSFLQTLYENGARPNLLVCGPTAWRCVSTLVGANKAIPEKFLTGKVGYRASSVGLAFGDQEVILDPQMTGVLSKGIFALDTRKIKVAMKRPTFVATMGKLGDAEKRMIITEMSLVVANPGSHGLLKGISTTA